MPSLRKIGPVKVGGHGDQVYEAMLPIITSAISARNEVVFGSRDGLGKSQIYRSYIQQSVDGHWSISDLGARIFASGLPGSFDADGVSPGSVVSCPRLGTLLFYTGWSRTESVPYNNSVGVASWQGEEFVRLFQGPLLTRTTIEPYNCASPFVMREKNGTFRMWYAGTRSWEGTGRLAKPKYEILYAESDDGISWRRKGTVSLPLNGEGESSIGRPYVEKTGDRYEMWFAVRGPHYVIGHAVSDDGIVFERTSLFPDLLGRPGEWDAEMTEYPWVVRDGGVPYMFYNGNGFGRTGIGVARIEINGRD